MSSHRRAFIGRGICAGSTDDGGDIADELRLPRKTDGRLASLQPGRLPRVCIAPTLVPHAQRRVHDGATSTSPTSLLQKVLKLNALSWFQLVLAATYSGAFHPTAEGQAAIADAVVDKARSVLKKYAAPERSRAGVEEPTTHAAGYPVE